MRSRPDAIATPEGFIEQSPLLAFLFDREDGTMCEVKYTAEYKITISGWLWPRELKYVNDAIQSYKEMTQAAKQSWKGLK